MLQDRLSEIDLTYIYKPEKAIWLTGGKKVKAHVQMKSGWEMEADV